MGDVQRTREDVDVTLQYAKLDPSDMCPAAQCLYLSPNLDNDSLKLIEVDNSVLDRLLAGQSLVIRGSKTDTAVLCTKDETFEVKGAETSNTLLLLPECSFTADCLRNDPPAVIRQVCALKHEYFELRRMKPRLRHLKECLEDCPYSGERYEPEHTGLKYTFEDLLETVQASEAELRDGLRELKACAINAYWRLLDFDYMSSIVSSILSAKDELSWSSDSIPCSQLVCLLDELYPRKIVQHVLECMSHPLKSSAHAKENESCYKLSEAAVCRFFGEMMLRTANKYHLREFEEAWQLAVPDDMKTNLKHLEGLALIDRTGDPPIISFFPVHELPEDIDERFHMLFKAKEKWTLEEITPYIEAVCVDSKSGVGSLLTRYSRVSTQKGTKLYSSRK